MYPTGAIARDLKVIEILLFLVSDNNHGKIKHWIVTAKKVNLYRQNPQILS